jgi:hypothetical protein
MAATTQANIDTLQSIVEADNTITNAKKAQVQGLLYSVAVILFGGNASSTVNANPSNGLNDGHSG